MRRALAFSLTLALSLAALPARAQPAEAAALLKQGVELRGQGKDAEALEVFRRAHAASPSPRAKAQIALAEQALGRWLDADRDLADALSSPTDPWIRQHAAALEQSRKEIGKHIGALSLEGGVPGAQVFLNGVA